MDYNRPLGLNKRTHIAGAANLPPLLGSLQRAAIEPFTLQSPPFSSTPRGAVSTAPNGRFDVLSREQTLLNVRALLNAERVDAAVGKGGGEEGKARHLMVNSVPSAPSQ